MNKLVLRRLTEIARILMREGFEYLVDELNLKIHLPVIDRFKRKKPIRDELSVRLRRVFEQLGGGFIKLGQLLSLRPDLIPEEFCNEFTKLQDKIPPFSYLKARKIVRTELEQPLSKVFKEFRRKPLGSASIGQAYFARLKNGKSVVVKVQRPRIKEIYESDLSIMYFIAKKLEKKFKKNDFYPVKIVSEFEKHAKEELDYLIELKHIQIFYDNFRNSEKVVIPEVYPKYSTAKILTIEYLDGEKLSDLIKSKKKFDRVGLTSNLFELTVKQIFQTNIFHADLHPGNIVVLPGNKIGLIDFGITGSLPGVIKEQGIRLYMALLDEDTNQIYESLLTVGAISPDTNLLEFKKELNALVRGWNSIQDSRVVNLLYHIFNLCIKHKIHIPPNLIVLGKALLTIEGTCLSLYPNFDFGAAAKTHILTLVQSEIKSDLNIKNLVKKTFQVKDLIEKIPKKTLAALDTIQRGTFDITVEDEEMKQLGKSLSLSGDRVSVALVAASFIVAGALIFQVNPAPTYFGYSIFAVLTFLLAFVLMIALVLSFFKKN